MLKQRMRTARDRMTQLILSDRHSARRDVVIPAEPQRHREVDSLRALPTSICIEITNKCNLRCAYCAKSDDKYEALPGNNIDMNEILIRDLYEYCKKFGIRDVSLSGVGETAMEVGWYKKIEMFLNDPEIDAHLVSNFVRLLNDDDLEALMKLQNLQISFDSSDIAMVRMLRSKADLRTITYNITRVRQRIRELGSGPNIDVNCVLARPNIGHIAKLAGFCRELGVDRLMISDVMITVPNNPNLPETLDTLTSEEVALLVRQIAAAEDILRGSATTLHLQDCLRIRIAELIEQHRRGVPTVDPAEHFHRRRESAACRMPWSQPFVRADGKVFACCTSYTDPVGDLASASLEEINEGAAIRSVRASILEGRPTVGCDGCTLARGESFTEFAREVHAWHSDAIGAEQP